MSLIADYQDSFGGPKQIRWPDFTTDYLTTDLDASGFQIFNLDLGSVVIDTDALLKANNLSDLASVPTARVNLGLHELATAIPTLLGEQFVFLDPPASASYMKVAHFVDGGDMPTFPITYLTPSEVRTDLGLKAAALVENTDMGLGMMTIEDPVTDSILGTSGVDCIWYTPTTLKSAFGLQGTISADTGWVAWTGTPSKSTRLVSTSTTANNAAAIKSIIDALLGQGILAV
jgi:hypothetical protein